MECFTNNRTQHYWHENNNAGIVVKRFRTGKKIANVKFEPSSSSSPFWLDCNCRLEREGDGECVYECESEKRVVFSMGRSATSFERHDHQKASQRMQLRVFS